MKLPYPIYPARIHTPGRFCDKPAVKLGVIIVLVEAIIIGLSAVAFVRNFF